MRAGELRHQVTLQSPGGSADSYGERTTSWTNVATVPAHVRPLTASESFHAGQASATRTHVVHVRYYPGVTEAWRVLFGSRALVITGVRNVDERNVELLLDCVEDKRQE